MSALTIDTLSVAEILRKSGMTDAQALGIVDALRQIDAPSLATKEDIGQIKADMVLLKVDIASMETKLELKLAEAKAEILKWMFGAMGFQTFVILGAVFAAIRALTH